MIRGILVAGLMAVSAALAGDEVQLQPTSDIIAILKSHYVDSDTLDPKKLNEASVTGILQMLGAGAKLLTAEEAASNAVATIQSTTSGREPLARVEIIEPNIGYIRIADVMAETAPTLDTEFKKLAEAKVTGYVLDLRYADGTNYAAAALIASRFLPAGVELFTLKQANGDRQTFRTSDAPKTLATELADTPLMLLVNLQTRGSAEVLVGALRAQDRGIVIGGPTAGLPVAWDDVKLPDGRVLRLATAKISLPKGGELFPDGIIPDIMVKIDPKTEREAVFNLQTNITLTASLLPRVKKREYSEAALVRVFRGEAIETPGLSLNQREPAKTNAAMLDIWAPLGTNAVGSAEEETNMQMVRDVVLQRAVDILKGIRVLLSWQ